MIAAVQVFNSCEMFIEQPEPHLNCNVPRATLQTRLNGKVSLDAKPGRMSRSISDRRENWLTLHEIGQRWVYGSGRNSF